MCRKVRDRDRVVCASKIRYGSKDVAGRALWAVKRKTGRVGLVYYRCRVCGGFHLGHRVPVVKV